MPSFRWLYFYAPLKEGAYCFATVSRSVCRPSLVRSISFDPFPWSIPNLVQGLPSMSRWSLLIFKVTFSKVKVKSLFSVHHVVRSIPFDPFTWSIPKLLQGLPLMRRWSLLIFRSHVQRSRSNHSSQPTVLSAQYLLTPLFYQYQIWYVQRSRSNHSFGPSVLSTLYIAIPCLLALDRFCFYREDKPEFCTMGGIYVSETIFVRRCLYL